jgi:hypothetical protein
MGWEAQLYGGEYYKDTRVGAYGVASKSFLTDFSITGETLYERYNDYNFSGVGGHLTWDVTKFAKFGLVGTHSREEFSGDLDFDGHESEDISNTLGLETELNHDPVTLAVQFGRIFNNTYNNDRYYLSSDAYYWGAEYLWYLRGAVRRTKGFKEYTIEGYRTFFSDVLPIGLYAGVTRNDLSTEEELRNYHTTYDSVYAGSYIEFFSTSSSSWNLWTEAARQDGDSFFSIELNVAFGPGADAPHISAFGLTQ